MQVETIQIKGMCCDGCTSIITRALVAVDGIHDVKVTLSKDLTPSTVLVQYDEQFTSPDKLKAAVQEAGYSFIDDNALEGPEAKGCCCE